MAFSRQQEITLVLVGKAGRGKSSSGNSILGYSWYDTDDAETCTFMADVRSVTHDNLKVKVVDTPGYVDSDDHSKIINMSIQISEVMSVCPEGIHAFCLVLKYGERFYDEEQAVIKIKEVFGPNFLRDHGIIILTHGDSFDLNCKGKSFKKWCEERKGKLKTLMKECDNRVVLFYNLGDDHKLKNNKAVAQVLDFATQVARSGAYSSEKFKLCFEEREKEILKYNIPKLSSNLQNYIGEMIKTVCDLMTRNTATEAELIKLKQDNEVLFHEISDTIEDDEIRAETIVKVQLIRRKIQVIQPNKPIQEQIMEILKLLKDLKKPPLPLTTVSFMIAAAATAAGVVSGGAGVALGMLALKAGGGVAIAGGSVTGAVTWVYEHIHKKVELKNESKKNDKKIIDLARRHN